MRYFQTGSADPRRNLACEEFLFRNGPDEPCLLLWVNDPCLVIGKYQNPFEEIHMRAAEEANLPVVRRDSGGGTVYHDRGNLNFTFIVPFSRGAPPHREDFLRPVIDALREDGIPVRPGPSGGIFLGDHKISGSAQCVRGGRLLHHGTLLFDADLTALRRFLQPPQGTFRSKAVQSVRSPVTNLREQMASPPSAEVFFHTLCRRLTKEAKEPFSLTPAQWERIDELARTKYGAFDWNFGATPPFTYEKTGCFEGVAYRFSLSVERAQILSCDVQTDWPALQAASALLPGKVYGSRALGAAFREELGLREPTAQALVEALMD